MNDIIIDNWLLVITISAYKDEDKKVKEKSLSIRTIRYEENDIMHHWIRNGMLDYFIVVNSTKLTINQMYIQSAINNILPEINSYTIGVLVHFKELFINILKDYDLEHIASKYALSMVYRCIVYRLFNTLINDVLLKRDYDVSCIEIEPIHIFDKEFIDKYGVDLTIQADLKRNKEEPITVLDYGTMNFPINIIKDKN